MATAIYYSMKGLVKDGHHRKENCGKHPASLSCYFPVNLDDNGLEENIRSDWPIHRELCLFLRPDVWKELKWVPALMEVRAHAMCLWQIVQQMLKHGRNGFSKKKVLSFVYCIRSRMNSWCTKEALGKVITIVVYYSYVIWKLWILFTWPAKCIAYPWQSKAFLSWLVHLGCVTKLNDVLSCSLCNKGWRS